MEIKEAIIVVQEFCNRYKCGDFLVALEDMHLCFDDLTVNEVMAYRTVMNTGAKFFAPV